MVNNKPTRLSDKTRKVLFELKQKNGLRSLTEAADRMADFMLVSNKKKKMKEKIIREIEF